MQWKVYSLWKALLFCTVVFPLKDKTVFMTTSTATISTCRPKTVLISILGWLVAASSYGSLISYLGHAKGTETGSHHTGRRNEIHHRKPQEDKDCWKSLVTLPSSSVHESKQGRLSQFCFVPSFLTQEEGQLSLPRGDPACRPAGTAAASQNPSTHSSDAHVQYSSDECPAGTAAVPALSFFKPMSAPSKSGTQTAFAENISLVVTTAGSDTSINLLGTMTWSE